MSGKDAIQKLIINYSRRLQKLKEQQALRGQNTEIEILIEIEDIENRIKNLQEELEYLLLSSHTTIRGNSENNESRDIPRTANINPVVVLSITTVFCVAAVVYNYGDDLLKTMQYPETIISQDKQLASVKGFVPISTPEPIVTSALYYAEVDKPFTSEPVSEQIVTNISTEWSRTWPSGTYVLYICNYPLADHHKDYYCQSIIIYKSALSIEKSSTGIEEPFLMNIPLGLLDQLPLGIYSVHICQHKQVAYELICCCYPTIIYKQ